MGVVRVVRGGVMGGGGGRGVVRGVMEVVRVVMGGKGGGLLVQHAAVSIGSVLKSVVIGGRSRADAVAIATTISLMEKTQHLLTTGGTESIDHLAGGGGGGWRKRRISNGRCCRLVGGSGHSGSHRR